MGSIDHQIVGDQLRHAFAVAMFAKVEAIRSLDLTKRQRARLRESIASDVRKACDILATVQVSEAANQEALSLGLRLQDKDWHHQPKFDPDRARFHLEHVQTVSAVCEAVCEQPSMEGVLEVLKQNLRVAWILKAEDQRLTALGFRHKRPDPDAAYWAAGIHLLSAE
jgi:hypothetical protein